MWSGFSLSLSVLRVGVALLAAGLFYALRASSSVLLAGFSEAILISCVCEALVVVAVVVDILLDGRGQVRNLGLILPRIVRAGWVRVNGERSLLCVRHSEVCV